MESFLDQFWKLYDKGDRPTHGIYKISLDEVADSLGYCKGFDSNVRPYYRFLHELTNDYLVENRDFITIIMTDDTIAYTTRFYNKHAFLLIAMLCKKHGQRNWMTHNRLMLDNFMYLHVGRSFFRTASLDTSEPSDQSDNSDKSEAEV